MIRVLLDTNIVLDALLDREPWNTAARAIWQAHLNNQLAAHITASTLTDIFYVARRHADSDRAQQAIHTCLDQLHVISVGYNELQAATALGGNGFEDNVQIACATAANLDAIVTRDPSGFSHGVIEAVEPQTILDRLWACRRKIKAPELIPDPLGESSYNHLHENC